MTRLNNVQVAAGFDQTLSDSDNIEGFTPTGGSPQQWKAGRAGMVYFAIFERDYSEGQPRIDFAAGESFDGFQKVTYRQPGCHPDAYAWLVSNYRGLVTAHLPLAGTTYADYNCKLTFQRRPSQAIEGWYEVSWVFTIIEAI